MAENKHSVYKLFQVATGRCKHEWTIRRFTITLHAANVQVHPERWAFYHICVSPPNNNEF